MAKIGNLFFLSLLPMLMGLFWLGPSRAEAQQGTVVSATVDRNKMEVNDTFTLTVTVQSSESVDIDEPRLPSLQGVELIQKWDNTSVQQSLVQTDQGMDFKTIRKREFHYMFQAKQPGRYSLDAFDVVVNGKLFKTEPIAVEIFKAGAAPPGVTQNSQNPQGSQGSSGQDQEEDQEEAFLKQQEDIFNQLLQRQLGGGAVQVPQAQNEPHSHRPHVEPQYRSMPASPNDAFFIQLEVDKTDVYEGEQVTATWYLLTRGQMESLDRVKFPALKGFWKETIEENPQIQFTQEIINGIPYRKALLASHALFPIKAGKALIDEFTVKSRIRMPSSQFGFGFGRAYEYTRSSKRLTINVKPLPTEGQPPHFTGAVGQFNVSARIEGTQFPVNQPFSLKIRFEGQGNAKAIDLPAIEWPPGVEVYDTKNDSRFFKDGTSFKEFEVLLIPRKEGPLEIPAVHFAFFNPKTAKYEEKETSPLKLTITPSANGPSDKMSSNDYLGDQAKKSTVATQTLPALLESPLLSGSSVGWNRVFSSGYASAQAPGVWTLWSLLMGLAALLMGSWGYRELKSPSRSVSLRKKLDSYWKKVEAALTQDQYKQVGIEIVNSFNMVLSEVSSHKSETQEIGKMLERLEPEKRNRLGKTIMSCYEEAQLLGFAPESALEKMKEKGSLKALAQKSKQVLNEICD